jgi:hypothetical protein
VRRVTLTPSLREGALVGGVGLLFGALFTYPVWSQWSAQPLANDWDGHLQVYGAAAQTLATYHQLPVWNPWECGGSPLLANPESHVFTPFVFLEALLGAVGGVKLEVLLHLALMVVGGYLLGREVGLGRWASWAPALIPAWTSSYPLHIGSGHLWALTYAYVPWVLWLSERAVRRRRPLDAALAGAFLALMANEGGTYPAPHAALVLSVLLLWRAIALRSLWPVGVLALAGGSAVLLSAPHLLPMYSLLRNHPRVLESTESTSWAVVARAYFSFDQLRDQAMPKDRWYWGFHECGAYLGPLGGLLALIGIVRGGREARPWFAIALILVLLGLGDFGDGWAKKPHLPFSLWAALHRLPGFSSQRVPSRFLAMASPALGILGGLGLEAMGARFGTRARVVGLLALALGAGDAWARGSPNYAVMYSMAPIEVKSPSTFTQYLLRERGMVTQYASVLTRANLGALNCWDEVHLPVAAVGVNQTGYQGEQFMEGAGSVTLQRWTPNRLFLQVEAPEPTVLVINQNYDGPWMLAQGTGEVFSERGRLAVRLPAGPQELVLAYQSGFVEAGLALFALGVLGIAALAVLERRKAASPTG